MVAMGVAALAGLAASKRLMRVVAWAIPVALLALMVYAVWGDRLGSVYGYTVSHLLDMGSATGADRMRRWGLAWDFIRTHPFNDYVWSWQRYLLHLTAGYEPHNFVLEVGTTEGIAGFVFYAAILSTAARTAWKHLRDDAQTRALACFLLLYVVFSTGNTNWYSYDSLPLFVAVIAALAARADSLRHDSARLPVTGEIAGT
jgi:O-antigen ligase